MPGEIPDYRESILFEKMKDKIPYSYLIYTQLQRLLDDISNGKPSQAWHSAQGLIAALRPKIVEKDVYHEFKDKIKAKIKKELGDVPNTSDEEEKGKYNYDRSVIVLEEVMEIIDKTGMMPESGITAEEGFDESVESEIEDPV